VAKPAPGRYSFPVTETERQLLAGLVELDGAVKALAPNRSKPDLLPLFARIDALAAQLPRSTAPDLLHYLQKKSYEKARLWLEGQPARIQTGGCRR
jgi:hypothetical protein